MRKSNGCCGKPASSSLRFRRSLASAAARTSIPKAEWPFFLSVELDSADKLPLYLEDPNHVKFVEEVIKPNITERLALDYQMEPGRKAR